jgi:hypothetical protein
MDLPPIDPDLDCLLLEHIRINGILVPLILCFPALSSSFPE